MGDNQPWTILGTQNNQENPGCALGLGGVYYGSVKTAHTGAPCEPWSSPKSNTTEFTLLPKLAKPLYPPKESDHDCRNPNMDEMGVWCYATNKRVRLACNVTDCLDVAPIDDFGDKFSVATARYIAV